MLGAQHELGPEAQQFDVYHARGSEANCRQRSKADHVGVRLADALAAARGAGAAAARGVRGAAARAARRRSTRARLTGNEVKVLS